VLSLHVWSRVLGVHPARLEVLDELIEVLSSHGKGVVRETRRWERSTRLPTPGGHGAASRNVALPTIKSETLIVAFREIDNCN